MRRALARHVLPTMGLGRGALSSLDSLDDEDDGSDDSLSSRSDDGGAGSNESLGDGEY